MNMEKEKLLHYDLICFCIFEKMYVNEYLIENNECHISVQLIFSLIKLKYIHPNTMLYHIHCYQRKHLMSTHIFRNVRQLFS